MNIFDIDHLELFVGDAQQAAFYYGAAFGLEAARPGGPETGLVDQRSLLMVQGEVRLVLTSGLDAEHHAVSVRPAARRRRRGGGDGGRRRGGVLRRTGQPRRGAGVAADARSPTAPRRSPSPTSADSATWCTGWCSARARASCPARSRCCRGSRPSTPMFNRIDHLAICVPAGKLQADLGLLPGGLRLRRDLHRVHRGRRPGHELDRGAEHRPGGVTFTLIEPDAEPPSRPDRRLPAVARRGRGAAHRADHRRHRLGGGSPRLPAGSAS